MNVYIVSVGHYSDMQVIGVASSPEEARRMTMKSELSGEFRSLEIGSEDDYQVTGPMKLGAVYNGFGRKVEI